MLKHKPHSIITAPRRKRKRAKRIAHENDEFSKRQTPHKKTTPNPIVTYRRATVIC